MNKEQCWHCQYLHSRTDPNFESAADFGSHLKEPTGKDGYWLSKRDLVTCRAVEEIMRETTVIVYSCCVTDL